MADEIGKHHLSQITFSEFISFLENGHIRTNVHWAPQIELCPFNPDNLHFVGKVETLTQDLHFVLDKLFSPHGEEPPITISEHGRQNATSKVGLYYDSSLADRVYSLYCGDFESLGYCKSLSL